MGMSKLPFDVKPVLVEWIDSIGVSGWHHVHEKSNMNCVSVGHLIKKDTDRIIICLNKNDQQHGELMEIPKVAIKKIRKLKI